jgi:pilus assembly protein CpaE
MAGKVLVADEDASVQRLLQQLLSDEGYEVVVATDGLEAFRIWEREAPSVVIVDATLEGLNGHDLAERIRAGEAPGVRVPIIILTLAGDVGEKVRALRAGADDYLVKPFHPAELLARLHSLTSRFSPGDALVGRSVMGRIHAYYGAKGGVGTTTIALNTGIALAKLGRRVCIVDANLQFGDHRVFMDLPMDRKGIVDVVNAPAIDVELLRNLVQRHESGMDMLLAPQTPEAADLVTPNHMYQVITALAGAYDYVIVDIDQRLDDLNLMVLEIASAIFMVLTADLPSLKNARLMLETIGRLGYDQAKVRLVLNRSNAHTGIGPKSAEKALRRPIDHQIQNDYRDAIAALNTGAPVMGDRADSALGKSIMEFAKAVDKLGSRLASRPQLGSGR